MSLALVTPPTIEPITVNEARRHVRFDSVNAEPSPDAPTVALAAMAGNVDNGVHRYRITFVTADGETEGGVISSPITVTNKSTHGQVALSHIPIGGAQVIARRVYRTVADTEIYLLAATIADNVTTSFTDNAIDGSLGAGVPVVNTTADPDFADLIKTARQHLENRFGRPFLTQTWRLTLDAFPLDGCIKLLPTLQSVASIEYVDSSGATQTLSPSAYTVDTSHFPGRVILGAGQSWPSTVGRPNAVTVTFVVGHASPSDVPMTWKQSLKLLIGHWYENRELVTVDASAAMLPEAVESLMWPDRFVVLA